MTASRRPPRRRRPGPSSPGPTPGEITREQTLQQSRDLLVAITEGTGDAVFAKDLSGRYLMINTIAARLLGTTVDAVVGRTDAELWPPEIVRRFRESDARSLAPGRMETREGPPEAHRRLRTLPVANGPPPG